ncbi:MAG TPA: peptidylprolyl isomerase, partial [Bryobacteraceae bacterium]|nr:peptidylprolyl isomerase [Bryobacteraceae bacterium]
HQLCLAGILASTMLVSAQTPPPALPAAPPPAPAAISDSTVVLSIGDEKITKAQFDAILGTLSEQQRAQASTPAGRKRLAESLTDMRVLDQEAHARKLDQTPRVEILMKLQADQVLAQNMFQELIASAKPEDADIKAYYDSHQKDFETVKAKHILIRFKGSQVPLKPGMKDLTEEEALAKIKDLRAKIVAGAKFDDLAKTESDDTGTAPSGGDLGEFTRGRMVAPFDQAAFAAKVGELTEPVKSPFGYHIILVESHATKTLEEAKAEIEPKLKQQAQQKQGLAALAELRKKKNVVFDEAYFGK